MSLVLVLGPATLPVSLQTAKDYIRVNHTEDDASITSLITTAVAKLDGRDGLLGRCLVTQTWRLKLDSFPSAIILPLPPCQSVSSITYIDGAGDLQTLAAENYQVSGIGDTAYARIVPAFGLSWPATRDVAEAVAVTFVAGYTTVPEPLVTAILQHIALLYDNRAAAGDEDMKALPFGYDDLIREHRSWRL